MAFPIDLGCNNAYSVLFSSDDLLSELENIVIHIFVAWTIISKSTTTLTGHATLPPVATLCPLVILLPPPAIYQYSLITSTNYDFTQPDSNLPPPDANLPPPDATLTPPVVFLRHKKP